MNKIRAGFAHLGVWLLLALSPAVAEEYPLHVVLPLSGNAAFLGQGQQHVLDLLAAKVNRDGGVNGSLLRMIYHDDQSSPQTAVQLTTQVIAEHPAVVLGSALVAMCNAMAPLFRNGPVLFCLSPGFHPAPGSFAFTSGAGTADSMRSLLRLFRSKGWTRIAMISSTDATGQDADKSMAEVLAETPDMTMVEQTHFNLTDISVVAQTERTKAARPDVFIAWSSGTALATIFKGILQSGLDVPVATTAGNFVYAQMDRFAGVLPPRLYVACALFPEHPAVKIDPRVEAVQQDFYAVLKAGGVLPDNMAGTSWDALMIIVDQLRRLGPAATATQLRDAIAGLSGWAGINGVYDFTVRPDRGVQQQDTVVTRWDAATGRFVWASGPGGAALN